jgi:hypothetical protein
MDLAVCLYWGGACEKTEVWQLPDKGSYTELDLGMRNELQHDVVRSFHLTRSCDCANNFKKTEAPLSVRRLHRCKKSRNPLTGKQCWRYHLTRLASNLGKWQEYQCWETLKVCRRGAVLQSWERGSPFYKYGGIVKRYYTYLHIGSLDGVENWSWKKMVWEKTHLEYTTTKKTWNLHDCGLEFKVRESHSRPLKKKIKPRILLRFPTIKFPTM